MTAQLRHPWSDGSTAPLLHPLELLERLTSLVPAPGRALLAYHGVLAPHAAWRAAVVVPPPTRNAEPRSPGSLRTG